MRPDPRETSGGSGEPEEPAEGELLEQGDAQPGGDPDAGPSVTPEEVQRGQERDQAEG